MAEDDAIHFREVPAGGVLRRRRASRDTSPPTSLELQGPRARRSRARAELLAAADLAKVAPASGVTPTQVTGRVSGRSRSNRDIAVSVNGRIEAVSRTFRLSGSSQEVFAVNVPEASLRPGRNQVLVFEVAKGGASLRLLGGS